MTVNIAVTEGKSFAIIPGEELCGLSVTRADGLVKDEDGLSFQPYKGRTFEGIQKIEALIKKYGARRSA